MLCRSRSGGYLNTPFDENSAHALTGRPLDPLYVQRIAPARKYTCSRFHPPAASGRFSTAGSALPRWRQDGQEVYFLDADRKLMAAGIRVEGATIKVGMPKALFDSRVVLNGGLNSISYPYAVLRNGQQFVVATAEGEAAPRR